MKNKVLGFTGHQSFQRKSRRSRRPLGAQPGTEPSHQVGGMHRADGSCSITRAVCGAALLNPLFSYSWRLSNQHFLLCYQVQTQKRNDRLCLQRVRDVFDPQGSRRAIKPRIDCDERSTCCLMHSCNVMI